jgi:hypothetical protein
MQLVVVEGINHASVAPAALTRRIEVQLPGWLYGDDPQEFDAQAALLTVEQHCADDREQ